MRYILAILVVAFIACFAPVSQPKSSIDLKQVHTDAFQIDQNAVAGANCAWFREMVQPNNGG